MILLVIVLSSCLTPALCCDWLRHYGRHSNASMILVNDMGGPLTEQKSPVSFPYNMYRRIRNNTVESQLLFTRDSLKLILSLYRHDNLSSIDWNPFHREHFLQALHRQMDGLNTCVAPKQRVDRKLRRYYRKLTRKTLDYTGGSTASWELIRRETFLHLEQLDLLVAAIRGRTTPSPPLLHL